MQAYDSRPPLLCIEDLSIAPIAEPPLRGLSLSLSAGDRAVLVGANGSGTETLCRCLAGLYTSYGGHIRVDGATIGREAWAPSQSGLWVTLRGQHAFLQLTVYENLRLCSSGPTSTARTTIERALDMFPALRERQRHLAGVLSGGERQMLAIARAIVGGPRVLVVDEPTMGLAPEAIAIVFLALRRIAAGGAAVLWTADESGQALGDPSRCIAMRDGQIAMESPVQGFRSNGSHAH